MRSTETLSALSAVHKDYLHRLAQAAIAYGVEHGHSPPAIEEDCPATLRVPGASFVTLRRAGLLRGCIGTLDAYRPLAEDVAENACAAAFHDPRFPPLAADEIPELETQISVLSTPQPMTFGSEKDLLAQLRPGVDGLILQEGQLRGTFLPSVWEMLPQAPEFIASLKRKVGLQPDYWSNTLRVWRYTADCFGGGPDTTCASGR